MLNTVSGRFLPFLVLGIFLCAAGPSFGQAGDYSPGRGWKLVWSDEFDGETLNPSNWIVETGTLGGGNRELQYYTETNAFVENGNLAILVSRIQDVFLSGRISTKDKFSFRFGKIVGRIRMPSGTGLWPAFWMLGTNRPSVNWPQCGEIDIVEMKGGEPDSRTERTAQSTIHWRDQRHIYLMKIKPMDEPLASRFHDYEMEWDPKTIRFSIDGEEYHRIDISSRTMGAFREPFYIILNVAVGGMFARIYSPAGVTAEFPQTMTVDFIRVYQSE